MAEPHPLRPLLEKVRLRLRRKTKAAEDAYVSQHTIHTTLNCTHHGRAIGDRHVCRIKCIGVNEFEAGSCHDTKARGCDSFVLARTVDQLRADFRAMSEDELRSRWPSVGELRWIYAKLQDEIGQVDASRG